MMVDFLGHSSVSNWVQSSNAIARCRDFERQVRYEPLPGRFIVLPIGGLRERWDSDQLALIKADNGGLDHIVCLHHDLVRQMLDRPPCLFPDIRGSCAR